MKIGDKVRVIDDNDYNLHKEGKIIAKGSNWDFQVFFDDDYDYYNEEDLKLIKTNMKKSDLKDGMTVKNRNGRIGKIVGNQIIYITGSDDFLLNFKDDLTSKHEEEEYDIVEIYESIWQREEPTELTMQEIADKFNIEVTDLKIKK